jgi:hypothetical protein
LGLIKKRIIVTKREIGESLLKPIMVQKSIGKDKKENIKIFIEILVGISLRIK